MRIAFNPSTVAALIAPPNNKDITFDLRGRNIFARGVKFCGTDTNTWRDIKINNVSIDSNILDLRDGSNTTLTNINGIVTINSTWRPVVDNLTSDSTTSSLSANQGRVLKALIDGKSDSDHTHDGRYVKKTGDTMFGALNFANGTWNLVGDDSYMGDCNIGGHFGIKAANAIYPGISFFNNASTHLGNLTAYSGNIKYEAYSLQFLDNGNTSVSASTWTNPFSDYNSNAVADGQAICVWGQSSQLSNLATDPGDMSLWLKRVNANLATLNMVLDGEYYANGNQRLAHVSEIPNSLKNPYALTISLNGTSQGPYDGSAAKSINITSDSIGAATSDHTHDDRYVRAFGTSNDNIDSDWGQSFKTFDPIPSGTPPEKNPNISILNIGNSFNRRKQLAFIHSNDNIYYRRHFNTSFTNWRRLAFANEIPTSLPANGGNADTIDGTHLNGIFTAFGNNAHNITATIGGVTKSFLVNWAADSDKLDGYHENSFLRYRETTSIDQENTLWDQIGIKQYNGALPDNLTNVYNYGSVISLPCTSTRFEIYASEQASSGNGLYYRSGWKDTKRPWLKFIDSSNIGSQSVKYAKSAGSANSTIQATNLTPENTPHYFRDPYNSIWRGGMYWGNAGNESMSFVVANGGTRFQFVGGSDIANWTSSTWQSVTPYLTIYSSGIVTPGSVTATHGFHHYYHDNNDAVLLAGGGYEHIFMTNTTRYYNNNTSYALSFHKLSSLCNNLVWVDGYILDSTSTSFYVSSDFYPYFYANSPSMRTIYRMDGNNMITVDGNGMVVISCSSYPRRIGFFYTGRA